MLNNEAFRRIRYALELDDTTTVKIFEAGKYECPVENIEKFSRKDPDSSGHELPDTVFAHFLNGLIVYRRGGETTAVAPDETIR